MTNFSPPLLPPLETMVGIAIACFLLLSAWLLSKLERSGWPVNPKGMAVAGGFLLFFAAAHALAFSGGVFIAFYASPLFRSPWIALVALVVGLALFALRRFQQGLYGGLEILGSIATIIVCASTPYGSDFERAAALLGAIYFFVRGLDNADKGELKRLVANLYRLVGAKKAMLFAGFCVAVGGIFAVAALRRDDGIPPPYIESYTGERLPIHPLWCHRVYSVCDQKSWEDWSRLRRAPPEELARANADFEARERKIRAERFPSTKRPLGY